MVVAAQNHLSLILQKETSEEEADSAPGAIRLSFGKLGGTPLLISFSFGEWEVTSEGQRLEGFGGLGGGTRRRGALPHLKEVDYGMEVDHEEEGRL